LTNKNLSTQIGLKQLPFNVRLRTLCTSSLPKATCATFGRVIQWLFQDMGHETWDMPQVNTKCKATNDVLQLLHAKAKLGVALLLPAREGHGNSVAEKRVVEVAREICVSQRRNSAA